MRYTLSILAAMVVIFLGLQLSMAPQAAAVQSGSHSNPPTFVGTFLSEFEVDIAPGVIQKGLSTLAFGGTVTSAETNDFGGGILPQEFQTGNYGLWEQTGPRQVTLTWMHFTFDETGVHIFTNVGKVVADFDAGLEVGSGLGAAKVYLASQDPLDPNEPPALTTNVTASFRRVTM